MSTHHRSRLRVARIVGLLTVAVVLTVATGWFVVYGLILVVSSPATDNPIALVIRETPSYPVLAAVLLAGLVATVVDLVKLARRTRS
ncbi:hypothetical protein [Burkholderia cepacia]|uniref:Transmembrane protein n=1 Tax=Burkholderia cepacia TaxID=292 RepID=A0ABM6NY64_BURCE|nr:hypothetical protein [Burkholderia cepacia]AIO26942.1 putative membrane protein [Burkholderia cepacia ATCC 25416]ALK22644.1 hypothetical protein APZ15_32480 [Burkholderia cepacia ATCC 25416]ASE92407.1 hypothetical protein CEQ23_01780 [Burkholderia cepacia]ATF79688.1 hypothetical protein CO711_19670 [Burkholderia cepacia]MCA7940612.1 hypothetical protein [Burkholderia cepacia]